MPRRVKVVPEAEPRATIKDVARMSGVSPATVSRVVNNHGSVRSETRHRVQRVVSELDYRPDSNAQALVTRSTFTVGLLIPSTGDSFWGEVAASIEHRAADAGFSVLLANTHGDAGRERRAVELFLARRVEGIIVTSSASTSDAGFDAERLPRLPIVRINWDATFGERELRAVQQQHEQRVRARIDAALRESAFEEVTFDDFGAAVLATEHLIERGHRRLAFAGLSPARPSLLRYLGFRHALAAASLAPAATLCCAPALEPARAFTHELLAGSDPAPTGIVAYDDLTAIGVIRGVHSAGLSVPGNVSVVGFDDIELAGFVEPPLTTVRQPKHEMGVLAMQLVLDHRGGPSPREIHSLPGELVVRASSGPVPGGAREASASRSRR